jgi:hypothetical protein
MEVDEVEGPVPARGVSEDGEGDEDEGDDDDGQSHDISHVLVLGTGKAIARRTARNRSRK